MMTRGFLQSLNKKFDPIDCLKLGIFFNMQAIRINLPRYMEIWFVVPCEWSWKLDFFQNQIPTFSLLRPEWDNWDKI